MTFIISLLLLFITVYYLSYRSIIVNDAIYYGPDCCVPVKVVEKNLIHVTISDINGMSKVTTIYFMISYKKYNLI